jgi:hypothetical protein
VEDIFWMRRTGLAIVMRPRGSERLKDEPGRVRRGRIDIPRSIVVTASVLITPGWSAEQALDAIKLARECSVSDTEEQREWILAFGAAR